MSKSKNKIALLLASSILLLFACGVLVSAAYRFLELWAEYDPKESAIEKITQCLDSEGEEQQEFCGLITYFPCWNDMKQSVKNTNGQYSVEAVAYNWEDHIPNRGGDEVFLQVTFADGNTFGAVWYEGTLESCHLNSQ